VRQGATPTAPGGPTEAAAVADRSITPSGDPVVAFAPEGYVGRPVDQVRAELETLGLLVQVEGVTTGDSAADLVLDVTPGGGEVRRGDLVLLRYAVAPQVVAPAPTRRQPAPVTTVVEEPVETPEPV